MKIKENGITLIALVVTIVVLLILAGVSISMLFGENGIIKRAQESKERTEEAQEKEGLELAVASSQMEDVNTLEIKKEKLENAIREQFGNNKDFSVTDNKDGSFLVSMNDTQRMYYIDKTGEIIDQSKMLKISTADELKAFRDNVNSGNTYEGWYVYLANDITLDINEEWEPIGLYLMGISSPDDENNKPFSGTFDGKNHEIDGIYINATDKAQGLFGLIINGIIKNVGIGENCNINNKGYNSGAIVGVLVEQSYMYNCYNKSDININSYSGGLVGSIQNESKVEYSYNLGNINSFDSSTRIGGITGELLNASKIIGCYNGGNINITNKKLNQIGGIAGNIDNKGLIEECFNYGEIYGQLQIGGIVGCVYSDNNINIQGCYNNGTINGNQEVGGIAGLNQGIIKNCYNIKDITGSGIIIGGIVGNNQKILENSYNTGNIKGTSRVGGVAGQNDTGAITNTYSLEGTCENIIGLSLNNATIETSELKSEQEMKLLLPILGSAFKEDMTDINKGYPILQWQ